MIESLLRQIQPKTTRERDPEQFLVNSHQCSVKQSKGNGRLRYQSKR